MLHKEFSEAGEATRAAANQGATLINLYEMTKTAPALDWPISGDQLAALKADAKSREEVK